MAKKNHKKRKKFKKLKFFILLHIGAPLGALIFHLWRISLRIKIENIEILHEVQKWKKGVIFSFWHGDIFAMASRGLNENTRQKVYILTSKSRDGDVVSAFLHKLGFGTVRGSSSRGGIGALLALNDILKNGDNTAFPMDGPRGPRYRAKSGALLLAKKTGALLLPVAAHCNWKITLRSWDRCEIPLPFSRCRIVLGKPVSIPPDTDKPTLNKYKDSIEETLRDLKQVEEE
jgi:lysophospholipid acyltransferase (LPLAT)-like uncharacterized protein